MNVTIIYKADIVRVHKAGCRDIDKDKRRAVTVYTAEHATKQEVASDFYSDFIAEGSMSEDEALAYCDFLPCTHGLPEN